MKTTSDIERVDEAARAYRAGEVMRLLRWAFLFWTPFMTILAVVGTASSTEMALTRLVAAAAGAATVLLWLEWRYSLHYVALLLVVIVIGYVVIVVIDKTSIVGLVASTVVCCQFAFWAARLLTEARRYARAAGPGWEVEWRKVSDWAELLRAGKHPEVRSIDGGSFRTGYWTGRILNEPGCSVVAKFTRRRKLMLDMRVRDSYAEALRVLGP